MTNKQKQRFWGPFFINSAHISHNIVRIIIQIIHVTSSKTPNRIVCKQFWWPKINRLVFVLGVHFPACLFFSLTSSLSLSSNLWFLNYPHLCHVCSRGSGNWVMVTTLVCNNGKKTAETGRWFAFGYANQMHYKVESSAFTHMPSTRLRVRKHAFTYAYSNCA